METAERNTKSLTEIHNKLELSYEEDRTPSATCLLGARVEKMMRLRRQHPSTWRIIHRLQHHSVALHAIDKLKRIHAKEASIGVAAYSYHPAVFNVLMDDSMME